MKLPRVYNTYNLFFILERALLLDQRKGTTAASDEDSSTSVGYYDIIDLPPLPPRYQHLKLSLPANWYDPGRNKLNKRKHSKTHGVVSFREMAKTVADNWKAVDPVTKMYLRDVANILKDLHAEAVTKSEAWMQMQRAEIETANKFGNGSLKLKNPKVAKAKQLEDQVTSRSFPSLPRRLPRQVSSTESMEPVGPTTPGIMSNCSIDVDPFLGCQQAAGIMPREAPHQIYEQGAIMPVTISPLSLQEIFDPGASFSSSIYARRASLTSSAFDPRASLSSCFPCMPLSTNEEAVTKSQATMTRPQANTPPQQSVINTLDSSLSNVFFSGCSSPLDQFASSKYMVQEVDMSDMEILLSYISQ